MKTYELPCYGREKSFYHKAYIIERDGVVKLKSYDTIVLEYNPDTGKLYRRWDGYSATTMRHINSFLAHFELEGGGKAWWDKMEVEK